MLDWLGQCWTGCVSVGLVVPVSRLCQWLAGGGGAGLCHGQSAARLCWGRGPGCFKQIGCAVKTFYEVFSVLEGFGLPQELLLLKQLVLLHQSSLGAACLLLKAFLLCGLSPSCLWPQMARAFLFSLFRKKTQANAKIC